MPNTVKPEHRATCRTVILLRQAPSTARDLPLMSGNIQHLDSCLDRVADDHLADDLGGDDLGGDDLRGLDRRIMRMEVTVDLSKPTPPRRHKELPK